MHFLDLLPEKVEIHTSQTALEWIKNSGRAGLNGVWVLLIMIYLCGLSIILFRRHTNVSLLGTIIYDVLKVVVLLRKFIYSEKFFLKKMKLKLFICIVLFLMF